MNLKNLSGLLILSSCFFIFNEIPLFVFMVGLISLGVSYVNFSNGYFKNILKVIIAVLSFVLIWRKFHNVLTTEFGVSLAFIMASLKTWELDSLSDYFNMFLILIVLESSVLVVNPSVLVFVFSILKIVIYFYYILKIQKYELGLLSFKRIILLIFPSLVFSLLLYFTFPRFTQGFIGINSGESLFSSNNTNLALKNLGELNLSDNKVFTVYQFPVDTIKNHDFYWRSVVLWDFFKGEWRNGNHRFRLNSSPVISIENSLKYNIKTENVYLDYLPHYDNISNIQMNNGFFKFYSDNTIKLYPPHKGIFNFLVGTTVKQANTNATELEKTKAIKLVESSDIISKTKNDFFANIPDKNISVADKIKSLNSFFLSRHFQYSQKPPPYNSIDKFIREGKLGYCSHFASAYAYLLRILNIPSRVVIGFQGGEINQFDQSIIVKERDAHAWVEYVDDNNSWKKFDPTILVAPERITLGSLDFFNKLDPYLDNRFLKLPKSWLRFDFFKVFDQWINYLETKMSNEIFNFDQNDQRNILKNKAGIYFAVTLILFLATAYYIAQLRIQTKISAEEREYRSFLNRLEKLGTKKEFYESVSEFKIRALQNHPNLATEINEQIEKYIKFFYR